jgi:hypothetical protein
LHPAHLQVIPASWLRLFSPREVSQLLGGGEAAALDLEDMQAHVHYRQAAAGRLLAFPDCLDTHMQAKSGLPGLPDGLLGRRGS